MTQRWELFLHSQPLAIARLDAGADIPAWASTSSPLRSVTRNDFETSIICSSANVPADVTQAGPFLAFEVRGPLDFTLTGVLSGLLGPLADENISVFTVSTFDTDWILVPTHQCRAATEVWRSRGHLIDADGEHGPGGSVHRTAAAHHPADSPTQDGATEHPVPDLGDATSAQEQG